MIDPNENILSENMDKIDGGAIERGRFALISIANKLFSPESAVHAFAIIYYHNLLDNRLFGKNHNIEELKNQLLKMEPNTNKANSFLNQIEDLTTTVVSQISNRKR